MCKCTNANNADNGGSTSDLDHHFLATIKNERNDLIHDRWTVPCKNLTINKWDRCTESHGLWK